ncbi:MBL fold metallo-hydrolase [Herpetosiphon giganteus]|uniref:MBL fold metallo-hydrolase n=1 Tax=Herpetosiphon giganteus TaxID=2029754 RepID=UPI00195B3178|nr:MBL fold metallo-hydrolase [Herpetosiphon giganteus]MBM7845155.1 glyoxylase-like metal-dependent hydrolase (beta-lactamase superfamily II) [Herpetosiphon giganteus]
MTPASVQFKLGDFTCTVLCDGTSPIAEPMLSSIFLSNSAELISGFRALSSPLSISRNVLLVQHAGKYVLIDTGQGPIDPNDPGHMSELLAKLAIPATAIETIIISHYHGDHLGGLFDADNNLCFPNARLIVPKREHEAAMSEESLAKMNPRNAHFLRQIVEFYGQRLEPLAANQELVPGISYVDLPGHTLGHSGVVLESQGERLLHVVDAIHVPLQLNVVDAILKYDADADQAIATRRTIAEPTAANTMLMAYHFPFPGVGRVVANADQLSWEPAEFASAIPA